ncbi:MAG: serine protease [bacterium]|nr:serine protease [bacterium]
MNTNPDEHLPPESISSPAPAVPLSESPDHLPSESVPPHNEDWPSAQNEGWASTIAIFVLVFGLIFVLPYLGGTPANAPNPYPNDPYGNPYNAPEWFSKGKLPPDTLSKLRVQELQEAEAETSNWLDSQRAKTPGEIYRMNVGAIVFIATKDSSTSTDSASPIHFMGSGTVVSSSKYGWCVLTAEHLLKSPYYKKDSTLMIYFRGMANPQPAKLVKASQNYDAMILQFTDPNFRPARTATLGKSSLLNIGTELYGIGNGTAGTFLLTKGIVSGKPHKFYFPNNNSYPAPGKKKEDYKWPTVILGDITIASGFSGGPLFNKLGQLVGVNVGVIPDAAGIISIGLPIDDLRKDFDNEF